MAFLLAMSCGGDDGGGELAWNAPLPQPSKVAPNVYLNQIREGEMLLSRKQLFYSCVLLWLY